ncbi:hypothetical protein CC79DRAFT_1392831 [Sarocladium strictum]
MSTVTSVPSDYPPEIIGYPVPWIADPGEQIQVKVSCTEPAFKYRLFRILQGYEGPNSPAAQSEPVVGIEGSCPGRFQKANAGSYAQVDNLNLGVEDEGLAVVFHVQPWLRECEHVQTLLSTINRCSNTGVAVALDSTGSLLLRVGLGDEIYKVDTGLTLAYKKWTKVNLTVSWATLQLRLTPLVESLVPAGSSSLFNTTLPRPINIGNRDGLLLAAFDQSTPEAQSIWPGEQFNGRLDTVIIEALGPRARLIAHYDFIIDIPSDSICDTSGNGLDGRLVNAPSRAVKGYNWDGTEPDWTKAQYGYGAIHFHEDDLDDAKWKTDFCLTVPEDARSGVYGVELQSENSDVSDTVVFFVRPTGVTPTQRSARAALVMSTFTYLAYANEHQFDPDTPARAEVPGGLDSLEFYKDENFFKQDRRRDLGLSVYDVHRDGSAVVYSSALRPLLNCRPDYVNWTGHRPRELSAELIMQGYMESLGVEYDVVTDHDLHMRGAGALRDYAVVLTGCHPEYPSLESYHAYEGYLRAGGNLMYLGGNGFYWSSTTDPQRPHRLEVRKGGQGVRTSWQEPGERVHALDGRVGGLWRDRGKAANYLVGVGCCGEGAGPGVPYRVQPDALRSHSELVNWVFKGLDLTSKDGHIFGRNALGGFGGGASADELDRMDHKYGSPTNIVVLASSTGHPDSFGLFPEDVGFPMMETLGTQTDLIRSDMTYYETCGGGAVFSVGSISWYCALGWKAYDNDVATITKNVLYKFLGKA